jgi:hypothetical protein
MIRLTYDPINGECMPDGICVQRAQELIKNHKQHNDFWVKEGKPFCVTQVFANELFFHAFRVQVKRGLIACEEVEVTFGDHRITINKDGRCHTWPPGFCDHTDVLLEALF